MTPSRIADWWERGDRFEKIFIPCFFLAFAILALNFPYSGDDWGKAANITSPWSLYLWVGAPNGRYAGNLLVLLLAHSAFLSSIFVAAVVTLCVWLVLDISGNRTRSGYLLTAGLMVAMPIEMWRQAIVWRSGFANYALAGICMLVFLRFAKQELVATAPRSHGFLGYVGIATFGFVSALFAEHVTFYLVVGAVVFVVASWRRFRRVSAAGVTWLLSVATSTVLMLSNDAYRRAATQPTSYQSFGVRASGSALRSLFARVMDTIAGGAVTHNTALNIALVVLLCLLVGYALKQGMGNRWDWGLTLLFAGVFVVLVGSIGAIGGTPRLAVRALNGAGAAMLLAALLSAARRLVPGDVDRWTLRAAAASVVVVIAPLAVVNPIGPRCFFPVYLLMLVIASLLARVVVTIAGDGLDVAMSAFFAFVLCAGLVANLWIYHVIIRAANTRVASIRAAVAAGATSVDIEPLPYARYVHHDTPRTESQIRRYKYFYGLPENLKITVVERP